MDMYMGSENLKPSTTKTRSKSLDTQLMQNDDKVATFAFAHLYT